MRILIALLLASLFTGLYSQSSRPYVTNYTPKEYGYQYSSYTQSVCTDTNGYLYAGTAYGILQFNGYKWNFIKVKTGTYITSLACIDGKIYVGCQGEFGYLEPDKTGRLNYVSFNDVIPNDSRDFTTIWKIIGNDKQVFFQAEEVIFVYDGKRLSTLKPKTSFHLAFSDGKKIYVRERETGLLEYKGNQFEFVENSKIFADTGVFGILTAFDGSKLVITQESGFFSWKDSSFIQMIGKDLIKVFSDAILIGSLIMPDGNIAVYTLKEGIYILNPAYQIIAHYSTSTGMRSSEILDITTDYYGNIWAATQKGVCRIQYSSPFSLFGENSGLYGNVQSVVVFDGTFYVGTTEGLFSVPINGNSFKEVSNVRGCVWALAVAGNTLWAGGDNGLWTMRQGGQLNKVSSDQCTALSFAGSMNWLLAAGGLGLQIYNPGTQSLLKNIPEAAADVYGIACRQNKKGKCEIWLGSKTKGVGQITISASLEYQSEYYYGANDGLTEDWICAYQMADSVLFATSTGFLRFVSPEEIGNLSGDTSATGNSIRGYFDISKFPQEGNGKSVTAFCYNPDISYIALDYYTCKVSMNDFSTNNSWFRTLNMGRNNVLYTDGKLLWIGADEGLAILDVQKAALMRKTSFIAGISDVTIGNDSIIWHGQVPYTSDDLVVSYRYNTLKINLASLFNDNGFGLQYSWMLEGADDYFTEWTNKNELVFNKIREGEYILHIKAKDNQDIDAYEISMPFQILPPWYRAWWAYVIYIILAVVIVYLLIVLNSRRLVAMNKRLEKIIKERTREIVAQKEEIEHQKETIEEILKDLNDSISYAQRIQRAILPSAEMIRDCFDEHFIIYRPRNVVSGDFFWAYKLNNWVVITVSDCTGHGVPGAFMSMLGVSFLNDIVRKKEIIDTGEILNQLRSYVIEALKQGGVQNSQKDGMDMSLCAINTENGTCYWSGANNPLWYVRKEDTVKSYHEISDMVSEVKADKMPVAIYIQMEKFTKHELHLKKGDRLYLFSDGYADQFGGPKGKKFMYKAMKRLVAQTANIPMTEQCEAMNKAFDGWLNTDKETFEQIDDVTVLGIKL